MTHLGPYAIDEIYTGDARELSAAIPDESVDLIFFDPPYGLGIADWDTELIGMEIIPMLRLKLKPGGSIYATCSAHVLASFMAAMQVRRIIAWGKPNLPLRKTLNEWEWSTEYVLWETRGEPGTFNKPPGEFGRDYWRIHVESGFLNPDGNNHPARKPADLLIRIVAASTNAGDIVLDPFAGSGTTPAVCKLLGRHYLGFEIDPETAERARYRVACTQPPLFVQEAEQPMLSESTW